MNLFVKHKVCYGINKYKMLEWSKDRNSFNKEGFIYRLGWKFPKMRIKKKSYKAFGSSEGISEAFKALRVWHLW